MFLRKIMIYTVDYELNVQKSIMTIKRLILATRYLLLQWH